jgi:hypothetical protein
MKIYVAGKFEDYRRVREIQELARKHGHTITFDWTVVAAMVENTGQRPTEDLERENAGKDLWGVKTAHLLIALHHPEALGTLIEVGIAFGTGKQIWLVGPWGHSVFWADPNVMKVEAQADWQAQLSALNFLLREKSPTA